VGAFEFGGGPLALAYPREQTPSEEKIRALVSRHGFAVVDWSYKLSGDGRKFEYHLVLQMPHTGNLSALAQELARSPDLVGFRLSPSRN
jgi:putative Mg2+ transporter-C (MgtC) family protein